MDRDGSGGLEVAGGGKVKGWGLGGYFGGWRGTINLECHL